MPIGIYKHKSHTKEEKIKISQGVKRMNSILRNNGIEHWGFNRIGKNAAHWKGDNVGYMGIHHWIKKQLGKASKCVVCDGRESQNYQWANISGEYRRDLSDWIQLCASCHAKYDWGRKKFNLRKFITT